MRVNVRSDGRQVLNDLLRVLGLTRARLARDKDGLVLALLAHVHPRLLGDGEDMGWVLIPSFVSILGNDGV